MMKTSGYRRGKRRKVKLEKEENTIELHEIYAAKFLYNYLKSKRTFVKESDLMESSFALLSIEDRINIVKKSCKMLKKEEDNFYDDCRIVSDFHSIFYDHHEKFVKKHSRSKLICMTYKRLAKIAKLNKEEFPQEQKILKLKTQLGCSETDLDLIRLSYSVDYMDDFSSLVNDWDDSKRYKLLPVLFNRDSKDIMTSLSEKGELIKCSIIDNLEGRFGEGSMFNDQLYVYLNTFEGTLKDHLCENKSSKSYNLSSFILPQKPLNMMMEVLSTNGAANLLLYGAPGTGKTEISKAIIKKLGMKPIFFKNDGQKDRILGNLEMLRRVAGKDEIIIVDEADTILNTQSFDFIFSGRSFDKGKLNNFFDESSAKIIWITNRIEGMESSLIRRFIYSYKFKSFNDKQRRAMWDTILSKTKLKSILSEELLNELVKTYKIDAGTISSAVTQTETQIEKKSKKEVIAGLRHILERQYILTNNKKPIIKKPKGLYDISLLDTDKNIEALKKTIKSYYIKKAAGEEVGQLNILFTGVPGTGKTALAKHLASDLDKGIISKKGSDLLGMFVGETEKKIRSAFEEAEEEEQILLIDEADSFIFERSGAQRSWEVSAVNEFLTNMENYNGVLICSTNFQDRMDRASLRRFQWKITFNPLSDKNKQKMYKLYFSAIKGLSDSGKRILNTMNPLMPGDFKVAYDQVAYYPKEDKTEEVILGLLANEVKYKKTDKAIGF